MNRLLAALGHLVLILSGYGVACLAASLFLNVATLWSLGWRSDEMPAVMAGSLVIAVPFVALFVAYFAFAPAALAIAVAEVFALSDWLYHSAAGGVAGFAVGLLSFSIRDDARPELATELPSAGVLAILAGAGVCGGFAYWAVAGRASGGWRGRSSPG